MNKRILASVVGTLAGLGVVNEAQAARMYSYVTDSASYNATPNQATAVKFYLQELLTGGDTSLINSENGVFGVGLKVVRSGGGPTTPSILGTLAPNNADFGGPGSKNEGAATLAFSIAIAPTATSGVRPGNTAGGTETTPANRIFLGTVQMTAGSGPGTTSFSLQPFDNLGGNTLTNTNGYDLDFSSTNPAFTGASANPTSFSVNVVPEPAGLGLVGVACVAGLLRRRRSAR